MNIIEYRDYHKLFRDLLEKHPKGGHGCQTRLAKKIGCQQAYLSRVIAYKAHLNSDQIIGTSEFFLLDKIETDFFLFLNLLNRSSNDHLKSFYEVKLKETTSKKLNIASRIKSFETLDINDIALYYSDWSYQAVHVATAVKNFQAIPSLAKRLNLSEKKIQKTLEFLVSIGVVEEKNHQFRNIKAFLHLPSDSDFIGQHHRNWRIKTLEALKEPEDNLHYSSIVSCSESDSQKIKEVMMGAIKEIRKIVKDSKDENIFCYNLDFFSVR